MRKFLFLFAVTFWTISLVFHLTAFLGDYNISRQLPFVLILHIGIFVVLLPAVFILRSNNELKMLRQNRTLGFAKHKPFFKLIFRHTPKWLRIVAAIGFIHAFFNFIIIIAIQPYTPEIMNGQYVLQNHGHIMKTITEIEFNHYSNLQLMLFTGQWIAFYGISAAVLYPYRTSKHVIVN